MRSAMGNGPKPKAHQVSGNEQLRGTASTLRTDGGAQTAVHRDWPR